MLGWEFPPHNSGGLGVACQGLTRALLHRDVEVLFVLPKNIDVRDEHVTFRFAEDHSADMRHVDSPLRPYVSASEYEQYRDLIGADVLYGRDLFSEVLRYGCVIKPIITSETFDVIHAHDWLSFLAGIEAKHISGKPLFVHVHATGFDQSGGSVIDERVYGVEKRGMEEADVVIAVSQFTKRMIVERYGISPDKIRVVHNGIDTEEYMPSASNERVRPKFLKNSGGKLVLFVGRLTLQKGPDYFLKAAARVAEYDPRTQFVIAGSGDMEWQIMREAARLGIAHNVHFVGFVRGRELDQLYRMADVFVLSSVSEPFGITPLEASMHGAPVVLSKQSGVGESLSHVLKVDFWDTDEMAHKIIAVLRYGPLASQLRSRSKEQVSHMSWHRAADTCMDIYNEFV